MSAAKKLTAMLGQMRRRGINPSFASISNAETKDGQRIKGEAATYRAQGDQSQLPGEQTSDARVAGLVAQFEGLGIHLISVSSSRFVKTKTPDGRVIVEAEEHASWSKER